MTAIPQRLALKLAVGFACIALLRHHADPGTPRLHDRPVPHGDRKR